MALVEKYNLYFTLFDVALENMVFCSWQFVEVLGIIEIWSVFYPIFRQRAASIYGFVHTYVCVRVQKFLKHF